MRALALSAVSLVLLLAGCDLVGGESPEAVAARRDAEGKAVGSACRHAMRAIEDCYTLNSKASKAAVFAGWREMDEYMRDNKLEGVAPTLARPAGKEGGKDSAKDSGEPAPKIVADSKPVAESKSKPPKSAKATKHAEGGAPDKAE